MKQHLLYLPQTKMPWTPDFDKTDIEEGYEIQRKSLLKGHLVFKYSFGSSTERILY